MTNEVKPFRLEIQAGEEYFPFASFATLSAAIAYGREIRRQDRQKTRVVDKRTDKVVRIK